MNNHISTEAIILRHKLFKEALRRVPDLLGSLVNVLFCLIPLQRELFKVLPFDELSQDCRVDLFEKLTKISFSSIDNLGLDDV